MPGIGTRFGTRGLSIGPHRGRSTTTAEFPAPTRVAKGSPRPVERGRPGWQECLLVPGYAPDFTECREHHRHKLFERASYSLHIARRGPSGDTARARTIVGRPEARSGGAVVLPDPTDMDAAAPIPPEMILAHCASVVARVASLRPTVRRCRPTATRLPPSAASPYSKRQGELAPPRSSPS